MNETWLAWLLVMISVLAVACGVLGRYLSVAERNLLIARVQYRTEFIERESVERQLTAVRQQLVNVHGLLDQHRELLRHVQDRSFAFECELQLAKRGGGSLPTALDDQTKALVRLATSNPNEHEKHAAAMLVCKRLREKLDA